MGNLGIALEKLQQAIDRYEEVILNFTGVTNPLPSRERETYADYIFSQTKTIKDLTDELIELADRAEDSIIAE